MTDLSALEALYPVVSRVTNETAETFRLTEPREVARVWAGAMRGAAEHVTSPATRVASAEDSIRARAVGTLPEIRKLRSVPAPIPAMPPARRPLPVIKPGDVPKRARGI